MCDSESHNHGDNESVVDVEGVDNPNTSSWEAESFDEKYVALNNSIFPPMNVKFNWIDITDEFSSCCDDLGLGELVHDRTFGLFEAMSAIEMMDPKMDAGLLCNRSGRRAQSFEHAVKSNTLKVEGFSDSELLSVMDRTFACIVSWLEGHSLAQTVFTNLYMHQPYDIEDRKLKVFCITIHKIVDQIKDYVQCAAVFEEEDFQPMSYGYLLTPHISDSRVFGMLKEVEDELHRKARMRDQQNGQTNPNNPHVSNLNRQNYNNHTKDNFASHGNRSCHNNHLNPIHSKETNTSCSPENAVIDIERPDGVGRVDYPNETNGMHFNDLENHEVMETASKKIDCPLGVLARIKLARLLYTALLSFGPLKKERRDDGYVECVKSLNHATEVIKSLNYTDSTQTNNKIDLPLGFEPLINQRLLPPTFPRYTKIKSTNNAYKYIEELLDRLRIVCKIHNYVSFHAAMDFIIDFSRSHPCVLSRSVLQLAYFGNTAASGQCGSPTTGVLNGSVLFVDVLRDACRNFIAPPSLVNKTQAGMSHMGKEYANSFFLHCIRPFTNLIQLFGHNHARQRDKLAHLLEDFAVLQDEAERVDAYLHNQYLSMKVGHPHLACYGTWVLYHTLQIMIMYLLSGFELELYSTHEYYYIYWYMYEFLYGWLISALSRAENFMLWTESDINNKIRQNKKPKNKKKKNVRPYEKEILHYQALQNMCGGYYKGLLGLRCDGKMKLPCNQFSKESIRFEHRFAPFRILMTPPPVSYNEFTDMTKVLRASEQMNTQSLYSSASEHFRQARTNLESIGHMDKEVTAFYKIAKWNFVVFKILADGHRKDTNSPPEFDFTDHNLFPSIKLPV